jgi:hypothetical protein
LLGEAVSVGVGEDEFALVVEEYFERAVVDVAVASGADSEYIMSQSRSAFRVWYQVVEMEPDLVRTARSGTAPTFSPEHFSFLSFSGVTVARIEADSLVLDG